MTCKYVYSQVKNDWKWSVSKTLTIILHFNSKTNMIESGFMWNNFSFSRFFIDYAYLDKKKNTFKASPLKPQDQFKPLLLG